MANLVVDQRAIQSHQLGEFLPSARSFKENIPLQLSAPIHTSKVKNSLFKGTLRWRFLLVWCILPSNHGKTMWALGFDHNGWRTVL